MTWWIKAIDIILSLTPSIIHSLIFSKPTVLRPSQPVAPLYALLRAAAIGFRDEAVMTLQHSAPYPSYHCEVRSNRELYRYGALINARLLIAAGASSF
jgi:hypothetical protein